MLFGSDAVGLLAVLSNPPTTVIRVLSYPNRSSQSLLFVGILGVLWPASASLSTTMAALNRGDGDAKKAHNIPATISVGHHHRRSRPRRPIQPDLLCDTLRGGHGDLGRGRHGVSNRT